MILCHEQPNSVGMQLLPSISDQDLSDIPDCSEQTWLDLQNGAPPNLSTYDLWVYCASSWLATHGLRDASRVGRVLTRERKVGADTKKASPCSPSPGESFIGEKAVRHVKEIKGLDGDGSVVCPRRRERRVLLVRKLLRAPWGKIGIPECFQMIHGDEWHALEDFLRCWIADQKCKGQEHLTRWRQRVQESIRSSGRWSSRWVREVHEPFTALRTAQGVVSDPLQISRCIVESWNPTFAHSPGWTQADIVLEQVRSEQFEIPPLRGERLKAAFAREKGAAGAEGCTCEALRRLPLAAWNLAATLFQELEGGAPWPPELLWVCVAPLPEPAEEGPPTALSQ